MNTFNVGDKVYFRDIYRGMHKAIIISVDNHEWYGSVKFVRYTIKITGGKDRVFYRGYTFETTPTRIFAR